MLPLWKSVMSGVVSSDMSGVISGVISVVFRTVIERQAQEYFTRTMGEAFSLMT